MVNENYCQDCSQKRDCKQLYQKLGNTQGSPVALKSIIAFLVPVVIFICVLGISEKILQNTFTAKQLQTAVGCGAAVGVILIYLLIVKAVNGNGDSKR